MVISLVYQGVYCCDTKPKTEMPLFIHLATPNSPEVEATDDWNLEVYDEVYGEVKLEKGDEKEPDKEIEVSKLLGLPKGEKEAEDKNLEKEKVAKYS